MLGFRKSGHIYISIDNISDSHHVDIHTYFHPDEQGCAQVCKSGGYIGLKSSKFVVFNFSTQTMPRIPCRHMLL